MVEPRTPEESAPPAPETAPSPRFPYRPLRRRAKWTLALLVIGVVADAVAVASDALEWALLKRIDAGELVTDATLEANDLRQGIVAVVQGGVFIVTAVFFIAWMRRAYTNLRALGAPLLRFGPGWAIAGWFVPVLNYWRPKQIANDIWRASNPDLRPDEADAWNDPVPRIFTVWWAAFLIAHWIYSVHWRLYFRADTAAELATAAVVVVAADAVAAVSGILAFLVVRRTTARQTARAVALDVRPEHDRRPVWRRKSTWVAAAAALVAIALSATFAWAVWRGDVASSGEQADSPAGSAIPGALVEDDFSKAGAWLIEDDRSLTFAYAGGAYRILIKEPQSLWGSLRSLPHEVDSVAVEVDASLVAGRALRDFYGVGCLASSQGSYLFGISPDGYYTVAVDPGETRDVEVNRLVEEVGPAFRTGDAPNRIRAECETDGGSTVLRLFVNGARLVERTHRSSLGRFVGLQFFVYSERGGTDVRFDNLLVRELAPPEPED